MKTSEAAALALRILKPFQESSLYNHYRDDDEDPFTDEEFDAMIERLEVIAD